MSRFWQDRTSRHVVIVVAVKLCLLTVIWWAFVKDARVEPDERDVAAAVLRATAPGAANTLESSR
jgi:cbb3-type cytochrome oxidase subunit 3